MYLDSFPFAHIFEFITCVGYVRYNYSGFVFGSICRVVVVVGFGRGIVGLLLGLVESVFPLVEGPGGELTVFECCFDVVQFLVQVGLRRGNSFGPMCQGVEYTLFSCDVVVAVPV